MCAYSSIAKLAHVLLHRDKLVLFMILLAVVMHQHCHRGKAGRCSNTKDKLVIFC